MDLQYFTWLRNELVHPSRKVSEIEQDDDGFRFILSSEDDDHNVVIGCDALSVHTFVLIESRWRRNSVIKTVLVEMAKLHLDYDTLVIKTNLKKRLWLRKLRIAVGVAWYEEVEADNVVDVANVLCRISDLILTLLL